MYALLSPITTLFPAAAIRATVRRTLLTGHTSPLILFACPSAVFPLRTLLPFAGILSSEAPLKNRPSFDALLGSMGSHGATSSGSAWSSAPLSTTHETFSHPPSHPWASIAVLRSLLPLLHLASSTASASAEISSALFLSPSFSPLRSVRSGSLLRNTYSSC